MSPLAPAQVLGRLPALFGVIKHPRSSTFLPQQTTSLLCLRGFHDQEQGAAVRPLIGPFAADELVVGKNLSGSSRNVFAQESEEDSVALSAGLGLSTNKGVTSNSFQPSPGSNL